MQLDDPARGFSFQADGPLDMRMSARAARPRPTCVNTAEEAQLADILFHLGEERSSRAIARAIVARRAEQRPSRARASSPSLVARVLGREKIAGRHAATRTFQALRIYVNDELGELVAAASAAASACCAPGGRLVVVTFHSLEDRLVKQFLQASAPSREPHGSRHLPPQAGARPAPEFPVR